ncbi:extracellular solute-binding protein [bacterium]|nr:MAG: extracellular solute-binding protein [bacterium]
MRIVSLLVACACAVLAQAQAPLQIRMMAGAGFGIPPKEATNTTAQVRRAVFEAFHKANPDIRVVNAGGLSLCGDFADNAFLMAMAGGEGPDVFYVNFRQYHTFLDQGFCRPLEDLIVRDPETMKRVNPTVDKVLRSYDGKRYAVPFFQVAVALYYRKDMFAAAGLDPERPPKDWDEFRDYARRLTIPGRYGFELGSQSYQWQNFLYQAGGEVVLQDPNGRWRSAINTSEAAKALDFYRELATQTWQVNGKTLGPALNAATDLGADIREGKTAMWFNYTNDVVLNGQGDLPPSVIGVAALPAGPAGRRNEVNAGMWAISSQVKDPKKLEACWRFIKYFAGDEAACVNTAKCVELGLGTQVNPVWLKKFGYKDLLKGVDPSYVEANLALFQTGHPEPYGRNCQQVYAVLDGALDRARLEPKTPAKTILSDTAREMDRKLLGYTPEETLRVQRGWTLGLLACVVLILAAFGIRALRRPRQIAPERLPAGISRHRVWAFLAACLAPAMLSIAVWAYYPLGRGLVMAFQDYRILGGSRWVGVDNFVSVLTQPVFYQAALNSLLYVGLSILVGFFLPILLALALAEIPFGKTFFRTVFYLPAMTSPIIIAFLWRQFYDKTDQGVLNAAIRPLVENIANPLLALVGRAPLPTHFDWLGNPSLAMFAVVLPGIWAGAGPGSILYLAALKNISEERYEAADLDGASWLQKIRYITLPGLKPLILINLLGVFIGGFKAMENVFVLTQGGPLNATRTLGLEVWQNAFMYLRFGYATAAAWVMGSILVGFTLLQIRTLLRMRFTTAR